MRIKKKSLVKTTHIILFFLLFLIDIASLSGQGSNNPFDLNHRKPASSVDTVLQEKRVIDKLDNPFDISAAPPKIVEPSKKPPTISPNEGRSIKNLGFLFWVLLTILLVFSSIYGISKNRIEQVYNSFLNENFLRQTHRLNQGKFSFIYLILYVFSFLNLGIFIFLVLSFFGVNIPDNLLFLCQLIGIVSLILLSKHFLLSLVGGIFPVQKEISLYSFMIMVFWILIGIFLFPINILIAYAPPLLVKGVIYGAVGAIIAILLYRSIRGISIGSKYLFSYKFHFFLYLCTVEILPVIVLLKIIRNYSEVALF